MVALTRNDVILFRSDCIQGLIDICLIQWGSEGLQLHFYNQHIEVNGIVYDILSL